MYQKLILTSLLFLLAACSQEPTENQTQQDSTEPQNQTPPQPAETLSGEIRQFDMTDLEVQTDEFDADDNLLPDLFSGTEVAKKTTVSGGILRDEENPDLMQSVEGAEISIEVKTGK